MRKIVIFILTILIIGACTSIDCPVQNKVGTVYGLKKANGTTDTLKVDTLDITSKRADGTDTILLNKATGITAYDMYISYTQPEDVFYASVRSTLGNHESCAAPYALVAEEFFGHGVRVFKALVQR